MDPLSLTLAVVSFATFLKDIVELGLIIRGTIDKVGQNQKRLRVLASDVVYGLEKLEIYYRKHECNLDLSAELKTALHRLHLELLLVRNRCQEIFPAARGSRFSLVRANVKAWARRDDIEADIVRLKEHINDCYVQFTAFTTVRIEHNQLVHRMEDRVRLTRMEGLFTRWLVETHANHSSTNQMFGSTITIDIGRHNIEYQFLRLQIRRIVDLSTNVVKFGMVTEESMNLPSAASAPLVTLSAIPRADNEAGQLQEIFVVASQMLCFLRDNVAGVSIEGWANQMSSFALSLHDFGMPDVVVVGALVVDLYRILVKHTEQAFMPHFASALYSSSVYHGFSGDTEGSLVAIRDSLTICRLLHDANPNKAYDMSLARALRTYSSFTSDADVALASARDSLSMFRALALEVKAISSARSMPEVNNELDSSSLIERRKGHSEFSWHSTGNPLAVSYETALSLRQLSYCLASAGSYNEAYAAQKESLDILLDLASNFPDAFHVDLACAQCGVYHCLSRIRKMKDALLALEKAVVSYRLLAQRRPLGFTIAFIDTLSIYASHLRDIGRDNEVPAIREEAVNAFQNLVDGSDSAIGPNVFKNISPHLMALGLYDEAMTIAKQGVDIHRLRIRNMEERAPSLQVTRETGEFVNALSNFATLLRIAGRDSEALPISEEALHALRKFVNNCPDKAPYFPNVFRNHSWHLQNLGRYEEAIAIAKEGADIYRLHICNMPETTSSLRVASEMSEFINILSAFSTLLQGAGRESEALSIEKEALHAFRKFVNHCPDQPLILPNVFKHHSSHLRNIGRHEEAIAIAKEGADTYRLYISRIPGVTPSLYTKMGEVVHAVCMLITLLEDVGRDSEVLAVEEETLDAFRNLANSRPDMARFSLQNVLLELPFHLLTLGRYGEAAAIAKKSLDIYRPLIRDVSEMKSSLASGLSRFATELYFTQRWADALAFDGEAVDIYRSIPPGDPQSVASFMEALIHFAIDLGQAGDVDGALSVCEEAFKVHRGLVGESLDDTEAYARVHLTQAHIFYGMGQYSEALVASEEATTLFRIASDEELGCALSRSSDCLLALGRARDALAASEEAMTILQGFEVQYTRFLVCVGKANSKSLATLGRETEALTAAEEAASLCRKAYQEDPCTRGAFDYNLADIICNLSICLAATGRLDDALANNLEAVEIYRNIVSTRPGFYPELAKALHSLSTRLSEAGRHDEAPGRSPELAQAVQSLSVRLWEAGRRDEAIDACAEIVGIRQRLVATDFDATPLLREAQDELAARISDKAQLTAPSADTTQLRDVTLCDHIPTATKDVPLPLHDSDIGQDVKEENGTCQVKIVPWSQ